MKKEKGHTPVLYEEALQALNLAPGKTIVDGTLGGAGHAQGILKGILPGGTLIGIDKDIEAIKRGKERLGEHEQEIKLVHADFKEIKHVLKGLRIGRVDGALLDLGVSSFQLEEEERGFSYMQDAPLDMRMDKTASLTAREVVNGYPEDKLKQLIRNYSEERWAGRIAEFIVRERAQEEIGTTLQLVRVIKAAIPRSARQDGPHPAKRTFQAIRIEVNGELDALAQAVGDYAEVLNPGGRLAIITFHSLEDRIVKQAMKKLQEPCECPKEFPVCVCGKVGTVKVVTRKPIVPSEEEEERNPRARSAKLRVLEKI